MPNFTPIRFETTEPIRLFKEVAPTTTRTTTTRTALATHVVEHLAKNNF